MSGRPCVDQSDISQRRRSRRRPRRLALMENLELRRLLSAIPLPNIPNRTFNITNYGAVADGVTDNTAAIQSAINAAVAAGGGKVEVPAAAKPFESGPLTLKNYINLQVDAGATLQMLPYGTYPAANGGASYASFIYATASHDVEVTGGGTIDGQGSAWWTAYNNGVITARPGLVTLESSTTIAVTGVTLTNAPNVHLSIHYINTNVTIDGITISTPTGTPNTDGIDCAGVHVLIQNSSISDGDDNIAFAGRGSSDITVTNCKFGVGHGLSIGSFTDNGGLNGLTVSNCTFTGTTSGIRMKSARGRGGLVQNLSYTGITMTDVQNPLYITSYYPANTEPADPSTDPGQAVTSTTPYWQNISINQLSANWDKAIPTNSTTVRVLGLPEAPVAGLTLTNVSIVGYAPQVIYNATGVNFVNSEVTVTNGQAPLAQYNAQITRPAMTSTVWTVNPAKAASSTNYQTIQSAIDAVPANNRQPHYISIAAGTYAQRITVPAGKEYITLDGGGAATIQMGADLTHVPVFKTLANNFTMQNLTIDDNAGQNGQDNALYIGGDRQVYLNCSIQGYQDTLYLSQGGTRQYFKNCSISGSVDFIYGAATGIFDTCTITQRVGGVSLTAPATPVGNYGLVFINSHLVNGGAITAKTSALARAWNAPYGQSVFVHTNMDNMISDAGWTNFSTTPQYTATERYDEYDSSGAGAAGYLAVPTKRAAQAVNMTAAQAAVFADITTWTPNFTTLFGGWNPNQAWAMIPATFTAASGAWETGGNWDVGQAPVAGQAAYAPSGSITVSAADSCDSLTLGTTAGGATLSVNAGASLRLGGALNTNSNGSPISKVTVSGAFTVGTVILGNSGDELHLTNNATFNLLSGWGGAWAAGKLYVDNATLAAMNLGGKFAGPDLYLAAASGQSGTWNIQPGNTYYLHAIRTGAGTSTITMTGGTVYGAYGPSFGYAGGGGAVTFNMKGGEFDVFNPNLGAGAGTYVFNQTGGTFQKDMNTFATSTGYDWLLGDASGANATWNLSQADGSAIVNIRDLFVGQKGTGKFAQTAGAVTINQEDATQVASHSGMRLGWGAGGNGTYEISGGSLSIANGGITNGYDPASGSWGTGTFRVLGGAAGTINVTGNYSQSSHSLLDDHVNASGLSTMSITGNVSFASGAAVNLSADAGAAPGTYTLMSWTGSATGTPVLAAGVDTSRWSIAMGAHALTATLLPLSSVAGTSGNDAIRLVRNSSSLDIYINNPTTPAYSVPFASLGALSVNSLGGNDSITVDFGGGASPVPSGGLSIDGGANSDVLIIAGTTGADTATVNATTVIFNNSPITYANVESISINGTSGNDVLTQTAQPGNSATLSFSGSGAKTLNLNGGSFALNSDASAATPNLTVNVNAGGSVTFATTQHLTALNITGGGIASMSAAASPASPAVLNVTTLGISGAGSKLDLADNEMWTTATVANVWAMIQGGQIASSSTGGALGYAGQASGVVEVRYTLIGDANLDGVVDVGDLGALASSYGMSGGATWAQGDFNGNGAVDVGDLGALATKYGSNVSSLPATAAATFAMSSTNDAFAIDEPVRKLIDDITT